MPKTTEELTKQYDEALTGLETLVKSMEEGGDDAAAGIEALQKAREAMEETKAEFDTFLAKAKEKEDDDDKDELDEDMQKAINEALGTDLDEDAMADLVKSSEAFEALEGTVTSMAKSQEDGLEQMAKSMGAQTNLLVTMAKAVGGMAKRLEAIEAAPVPSSSSKLRTDEGGPAGDPITKSRGECQELITKAVREDRVDSRWLSVFGARGMTALEEQIPAEVQKECGII